MGMLGVRIGMVMRMIMVVMVLVLAVVVMAMIVVVIMLAMTMRMQARADALDVMMMAHLRQTDFRFEAQHLRAVFAQAAVHISVAAQDLADALGECVDDERVVVEIRRLDELDSGIKTPRPVDGLIDALDQNAGEQEIGKDDDAPVTESCCMFESREHKGKGDARICGLGPAEAEALPQHAGELADV